METKMRWDFVGLAVIAAVAIMTVGFVSTCEGSWKVFPDEPSSDELRTTLNSWKFDKPYEAGVFDCSDMSITTAYVLDEGYGFNVWVATGLYSKEQECFHSWVFVETGDMGWIPVETTYKPEERIGTIVIEEKYYNGISYLHSWEDALLVLR